MGALDGAGGGRVMSEGHGTRVVTVFDIADGSAHKRVMEGAFTAEYSRRFELVQQKLEQLRQEYVGARIDSWLVATIACRLTHECGFPVFVAQALTCGKSLVHAYPAPEVGE